jgi:hypothetical protein
MRTMMKQRYGRIYVQWWARPATPDKPITLPPRPSVVE